MITSLKRSIRKIFSRITLSYFLTIATIFNSVAPALLLVSPVHASSPTEVNLVFNSTSHSFDLTASSTTYKVSYALYFQTSEKTDATIGGGDPTDGTYQASVYAGTKSDEVGVSEIVLRGILKTQINDSYQAEYFVMDETTLRTVLEISASTTELSESEQNWLGDPSTYGDLQTGITYHAPFDQEVSVNFTSLPSNPGTITFRQVTLTLEQVKESGALSDIAYDITSSMEDGTFAYNLSLPIPDSSKGKDVEVKFAEELSSIGSAEKVENTLTKTDTSVSVESLDHFTIFIITDDSATYSGTWIDYASQGYSEDGVHYSTTVPAGETATWTFSSLIPTGLYNVYVSWSTHSNRTQVAPYVLNYNGGSTSTVINQEQLADQTTTGGSGQWSGWFYLGTHNLNTSSNLVLTSVNNASGTDYVIADEVLLAPNTAPTTVWIDDNYTINSKNDGHVWGYDAFAKIQEGINAVDTDGTVNVATGTYPENIYLNKAVNLIGADKDTTTISNTGGAVITINSVTTSMTISGFTIDALNTPSESGIVVQTNSANITIEQNIIKNFTENGITISNSSSNKIKNNTISGSASDSNAGVYIDNNSANNDIDGNIISLATSGTKNLYGVYLAGSISGNNTVKNNTINGGLRAYQQDGGVSGTVTFSGNTIGSTTAPSYSGVFLNGGSAVISGNTIKNAVRPIEFWGAHDVTITDNILDGTTYDFINIGSFTGTLAPIQHNAFLNMGTAKLQNRTGNNVVASENYWGDLDPSDNILNSGGGSIDYSPWWGENYVGNSHSSGWTWYTNDSIKDAINAATSGDTINVAAGTYAENIYLDKAVNLIGAGKDTTKISNTGGAVITIDSVTSSMTISGFTIDALNTTSPLKESGIVIQLSSANITIEQNNIINFTENGITISNCNSNKIKNNTISGSASGSNAGVYIDNSSANNDIEGNTISLSTSGTGNLYNIYFAGSITGNNTVTNNTINGGLRAFQQDGGVSGIVTFSDNIVGNITNPTFAGVYLNGGSAIISGNTIKNSVRPIEFWGAVNVTISNNTFDGSTYYGINAGSYLSTTANNNTFNNISQVLNNQQVATQIDAENNDWGVAGCPSILAKLNGDIDYLPYVYEGITYSSCTPVSGTLTLSPKISNTILGLTLRPDIHATGTVSNLYPGATLKRAIWNTDTNDWVRNWDTVTVNSGSFDEVLPISDCKRDDSICPTDAYGRPFPEGNYKTIFQAYDGSTVIGPVGTEYFTIDNTAPTSSIFFQADLDETKNITTNNRWFESFDNIDLKIDTGDQGADKINYQVLNGDVACPAQNDSNYTATGHNTNLASIINAKADGAYSMCYYASDLAGNTETSTHKELLRKDNTNPSFTIDSVSGNDLGGVYYNQTGITAQITVTDSDSGYSHARYDLYNADSNHTCTTSIGSNQDSLSSFVNPAIRTLSKTGLSDGNYCLRVWVYDNVQNKVWTDTSGFNGWIKFTIDSTLPTNPGTPTTTPNPTNSTSQNWVWTSSTDLNDIFQYLWRIPGYSNGTVLGTSLITSLGEGIWSLFVKAQDNAGNQSGEVNSTDLTVDTTPPTEPTATFTANGLNVITNGYTNSKIFTFNLSSTDATRYQLKYWNNIPGSSYKQSTPWNPTTLSSVYPDNFTQGEGIHYFSFSACDIAGNCSPYSTTPFTVTYDATSPVFDSKTTFSGWHDANQTSTFNYSDINMEAGYVAPTCDITTEGANQTCSITPNICDKAGNCNITPQISDGADIDKTKPTSIVTLPTNTGDNSIIITNTWDGTVAGTATDTNSGVANVKLSIKRNSDGFYWNGVAWATGTENTTRFDATGASTWSYTLSTPAEDTYTITSHAIDVAGNVENSYQITIILDKTIPEVNLSISPATPDGGNNWYITNPTITLTANDTNNIQTIEYQWNSNLGTWTTDSSPFQTPGEGAHILYYKAQDNAGNWNDTGIKNVRYDNTELTDGPQNISVTPNPTSGTTATVSWEAASDNVGIDHYGIEWKLDSTYHSTTVGSDIRSYDLDQLDFEGDWNVKVVAYDGEGHSKDGSVTLTVDRTSPVAPTLILTGTGTGTASLSWNSVAGATGYIIWYGTTPGSYIYGANVGNTTNYTVQGLGAGTYYFIVRSYDGASNSSGDSNEVTTGAIAGAVGVEPGTPATGFTEEPAVLGEQTTASPNPSSDTGEVLGATLSPLRTLFGKWWFWFITISLLSITYFFVRRPGNKNG